MADHLTELKEACSSHGVQDPEEKIKGGESRWFIGHPSPAAPGTVALAQPSGLTITFREKDVLEVRRHQKLFLVRTSADANLLVAVEQVVNAASINRCDCGSQESTPKSARMELVWTHWGDDVYIRDLGNGCAFQWDCKWVDIPLLGSMYLCIPSGYYCS